MARQGHRIRRPRARGWMPMNRSRPSTSSRRVQKAGRISADSRIMTRAWLASLHRQRVGTTLGPAQMSGLAPGSQSFISFPRHSFQ